MKTKDYSYCNNSECIHRRGCKRFIGNQLALFEPMWWVDDKECVESDYSMLDRYRFSDCSEIDER